MMTRDISVIERCEVIEKSRALTDAESMELERAIRRTYPAGTYRRWSIEESRALLIAARVRGGMKAYAENEGRTYAACQNQLRNLKAQRRRRGVAFVGRFFYDGEVPDSRDESEQ